MRISIYDSLTKQQIAEILDYYSVHSAASTCNKFNLPKTGFTNFITTNGCELHSTAFGTFLAHCERDNFNLADITKYEDICNFYLKHSTKATLIEFKLKEYYLNYILDLNNIQKHTSSIEMQLALSEASLRKRRQSATYTHEKRIAANELSKQTKLSRYGDENYNNRVKYKNTCLEKYGVENAFQNDIIKEKSSQTKLFKYNNSNYTNREKAAQTNLERYGAETFLGSDRGQAEIKKYSQSHYGTDYAFLSPLWQNNEIKKSKAAETKRTNKYTFENYSIKYLELANNLEELKVYVADKTIYEIATDLEISRDHAYYLLYKNNLLDLINKVSIHSHYEDELIKFIGPNSCVIGDRDVLDGYEIDIFIPTKNIGIEFNGTYWHSSINKPDRNYHINKSKLAESKGIRLIHIWEYEWADQNMQEKIKLMLNIALGRVKNKIYARDCEIRQITNNEAKELNNKVHLQGHRNAQITYGLYYNNELVQLMSFSKTKYNKNLLDENSWEIIRGCPGSNNIVVGGVSKLLSHFIKDYKPNKIFSYCDFNKFDGKSYEKAGMKFIGYTGPDMKWVVNNFNTVINRQPSKHSELKEKAVAQLFGCGSKKYMLELCNNIDRDRKEEEVNANEKVC